MASSSNEEIIQQARLRGVARGRRVESESFCSEDEDGASDCAGVLYALFGAGDEYAYIYETEEEHRPETPAAAPVDIDRCFEYVKENLPPTGFFNLSRRTVADLLAGYAPAYIAVHCNGPTLAECHLIEDLIEEYKNGAQKLSATTPTTSSTATTAALNTAAPGLLSPAQFAENIAAGECLHLPAGASPSTATQPSKDPQEDIDEISWGADSSDTPDTPNTQNPADLADLATPEQLAQRNEELAQAQHLLAHPHVRAALRRAAFFERMGATATREALQRLYAADTRDSLGRLRLAVFTAALTRAARPAAEMDRQLLNAGFPVGSVLSVPAEDTPFDPWDTSLQRLTNAIVSLQGPPGTYAGIFLTPREIQAVRVSECGRLTAAISLAPREEARLQAFLDGAGTCCLTASTPSVRFLLRNCPCPMVYVPRTFALGACSAPYALPLAVARAVQQPLIHFARFIGDTANTPAPRLRVLKRAVAAAAAVLRPDWAAVHRYEHGFALLRLLKIPCDDPHVDFAGVGTLEELTRVLGSVATANAGAFFTLSGGTAVLDATHVHPKDYSWAAVLCRAAHRRQGGAEAAAEAEAVRAALNDPRVLRTLELPPDTPTGDLPLQALRALLLSARPAFFAGATDAQIFRDVVPILEIGREYDGLVRKEGADFLLVDVGGATVFVRKEGAAERVGEACVNQLVRVRVLEAVHRMLSYQGEAVEPSAGAVRPFVVHPLFRAVGQAEVERLLEEGGEAVLVRAASVPEQCVVVCFIENGLYFSFRLCVEMRAGEVVYVLVDGLAGGAGESGEGGVAGVSTVFSSLSEFLDLFVDPMYVLLEAVRGFRYFFGAREEAAEHLQRPGPYLKYALCFSRSHPGFLEFLYGTKRVVIQVFGPVLRYKEQTFRTVEEFIAYAKTSFN